MKSPRSSTSHGHWPAAAARYCRCASKTHDPFRAGASGKVRQDRRDGQDRRRHSRQSRRRHFPPTQKEGGARRRFIGWARGFDFGSTGLWTRINSPGTPRGRSTTFPKSSRRSATSSTSSCCRRSKGPGTSTISTSCWRSSGRGHGGHEADLIHAIFETAEGGEERRADRARLAACTA